jgi:type 2 lantibiotic biosynthesis protein LanM
MKDNQFIYRASTIDEIISQDFISITPLKSSVVSSAERLAAWCKACASGNWDLFKKRLDRDNLTFEFVLSRFANAEFRDGKEYPIWFLDSRWIKASLVSELKEINHKKYQSNRKVFPFEGLFENMLDEAEHLVYSDINDTELEFISAQAKLDLRYMLLEKVSELCAQAIFEAFNNYSYGTGIYNDLAKSETSNLISSVKYDSFLAMMRSNGFDHLFDEKPVLLRLISTITRQWIDTTREFIIRFTNDYEEIKVLLSFEFESLIIERITGDLSDAHNSGHSVLKVELNYGCKLLYKPKDCRLDLALNLLIKKFNDSGANILLRSPKIIALNGYGWAEYINHSNCNDVDGVKRFFERSGAWLAIFHALNGVDMHFENIIADGEFPVPIDMEMILQSRSHNISNSDQDNDGAGLAVAKTIDSVLSIGLLPAYIKNSKGDLIGTGGMSNHQPTTKSWRWDNINTDLMKRTQVNLLVGSSTNLPYLNNHLINASDYVDQILNGFKLYYKFLMIQRDISGLDFILDGFSDLSTRHVLKPTRFYHSLLKRLSDHNSMSDGITWSAEIDFVSRFADWDKAIDKKWNIVSSERLQLQILNIPIFYTSIETGYLFDHQGLNLKLGFESGLIRAKKRIQDLCLNELSWQCQLIYTSLKASSSYLDGITPAFDENLLVHSDLSPIFFLDEAIAIATVLKATAIRSENSAAWIGIEWHGDTAVSQLTPLGTDLYNGSIGISLFLSSVGRETNDQDSVNLAYEAISSLRKDIFGDGAHLLARRLGLGGVSGLGSIVYGLTTLSQILDDDQILTDAMAAAKLFSDDLIKIDDKLDIVNGSAGAILCLLKLYKIVRKDWVLDLAIKCGDHLLNTPRIYINGLRSWVGVDCGKLPLCGMSHGAAGFALALSSLSLVTGRNDFGIAASECINFENSFFDIENDNWLDLREGVPKKDSHKALQWCHGAIGIGLARIGMKDNHNNYSEDVVRALSAAKLSGTNIQTSLCCGELGKIEFIYEAAKHSNDESLFYDAKFKLFKLISNAHRFGGYEFGGGTQSFHLSLFRGIAGVGYTALRQVNNNLPNILLLE